MEVQKPRPNFTKDVTAKVIELMESEGQKPWEASWDRGLTKAFNPYTAQKGKQGREYRGANAIHLLMGQLARDSADPRWLTFKQAKQAGLSIRKGAVEAMSRALAVDLGRYGVRVNVIRPGIVPSELRGSTEEEERARFSTGSVFPKQALSLVGDAMDVAGAVAWLCGEGGRWVTGAVIDIDGGYALGVADPPV